MLTLFLFNSKLLFLFAHIPLQSFDLRPLHLLLLQFLCRDHKFDAWKIAYRPIRAVLWGGIQTLRGVLPVFLEDACFEALIGECELSILLFQTLHLCLLLEDLFV